MTFWKKKERERIKIVIFNNGKNVNKMPKKNSEGTAVLGSEENNKSVENRDHTFFNSPLY